MEEHNARLYLTHASWVICLTFGAVALEFLGGQLGLLCPGAFLLGFYLTVAYGWRLGLMAGCVAMMITEIVLGRSSTLILVMPLVVAGGHWWKTRGDSSTLFSQLFPGALLGAFYAGSAVATENVVIQPPALAISLPALSLHVVKGLGIGLFLLPLFVALADWLAERIDLNLYHRQAPRARKRKG